MGSTVLSRGMAAVQGNTEVLFHPFFLTQILILQHKCKFQARGKFQSILFHTHM